MKYHAEFGEEGFMITNELLVDSMPLHWRIRHWASQEARVFTCFIRGHKWVWHGGRDYETGQWDGEESCNRCGALVDYPQASDTTLKDLYDTTMGFFYDRWRS